MYFKELLRARNALMWYILTWAVVAVFVVIVNASAHGHAHVTVSDLPKDAPKIDHVPWMVFYILAAWSGAIMATILGSTLSQENDHLPLAWTKPRSRTAYATAIMAVDAVAICISTLIAFGFITAGAYILAHNQIKLGSGPDDGANLLRFTLFPLAWYALIVALSATLRNKAGLVQGLIWPIAIGIAGGLALPAPWHQIFSVANLFNPLIYTGYESGNMHSGVVIDSEPGSLVLSAGLSALVLAAFVAAGWFAATFRWKRLEA